MSPSLAWRRDLWYDEKKYEGPAFRPDISSQDARSAGGQEASMLDVEFSNVYTKFKLHFYQKVFSRIHDREASLTTVEAFCMEIIQALNKPTINEFANFINISPPNAAYKVNSLVKKGYLTREQSDDDKREYHLCVTQKYNDYYNISYQYLSTVMDRIEKRFSQEDVARLEEILHVISSELMPEIPIPEIPGPPAAEENGG